MPAFQPTAASIAAFSPCRQPSLPLVLPSRAGWARLRGLSCPFLPADGAGPYRLPREARERLAGALAPARNREAAFALGVFLARFWSSPGRLALAFPIDRRALADRVDLGLTEARVRGALRALEEVGFLDRALPEKGSAYRLAGPGGELHRKPVLFRFGREYAPLFAAANGRAAAARGGHERARRPLVPPPAPRPSTALPGALALNSPKTKGEAEKKVLMGEIIRRAPGPQVRESALEAALERWRRAIEEERMR